MSARARHTDPETSHVAAARIGNLKVTQQAVLVVLRALGQPVLDEELIAGYERLKRSLKLPDQSESGLRTRRSELANMVPPRVLPHARKKMSTGGVGLTWYPAPREET